MGRGWHCRPPSVHPMDAHGGDSCPLFLYFCSSQAVELHAVCNCNKYAYSSQGAPKPHNEVFCWMSPSLRSAPNTCVRGLCEKWA